MISIQHACLPSVLAYAAATTLPPSPTDSPPRCDTPTSQVINFNLPSLPLKGSSTPLNGAGKESGEDIHAPALESSDRSPNRLPELELEPRNNEPSTEDETVLETVLLEPQVERKPVMEKVHKVSFAQFASQIQLQRHQRIQKRNVLRRLWNLRVCIALSSRLLRVASTVQKGLVENFKHGDKAGFISVYNSIFEIRDLWESFSKHHVLGHDEPSENYADRPGIHPCSFTQRLTPRSREDLVEILTRVRTDSDFLFQCLVSLSPAQLSALISTAHALDAGEASSPLGSRNKPPSLFSKRANSHSNAIKEHAFAFERTDPISALLFNVFAAPLESNSPESYLRLNVWSSTCAKLISHGGSGYYSFVGQILSIWSGATEWKAKPKLEIYLMDVLQKGAFLLEYPDNRRLGLDTDGFDPLRTDVAEQFFQAAVHDLFAVLDDSDAGLPAGAIELGNAILGKLGTAEFRKRFLDFIFFQWFFRKHLPSALSYLEAHGLMLDFHITKDARERLLGQISHRAQFYVSRILQTPSQYTLVPPRIRHHIEKMLSHFNPSLPKHATSQTTLSDYASAGDVSENFLFLSPTDITTILDVIFPKAGSLNSAEPTQNFPNSLSPTFCSGPNDGRTFEPSLFQGRMNSFSSRSFSAKTVFTTEISSQDSPKSYYVSPSRTASPVSPQESFSRNADRIRYELSEINESEDRHSLDAPTSEDWAIIAISTDGHRLSLQLDGEDSVSLEATPTNLAGLSMEDQNALENAIFRLTDEFDPLSNVASADNGSNTPDCAESESSLRRGFINAMIRCQRQSDFPTSHYWWNAARLLRIVAKGRPTSATDDKVLNPLYWAAKHSADFDFSIVNQCSPKTIGLKHTLNHFQSQVKSAMGSLAKLRNKMWYMTDVKNSLRYEDARNVALALKSMAGFQALSAAPEPKSKFGSRSLGGSFLQKPEIQVMNVMKAPASQGGPTKLSDEQVDITRKWLHRSGIDNFCRGEERIHRFSYEVKTSVSKLVGESMYDSPVLWSSELFQKERSMFEAAGARPLTGLSTGTSIRPSSITSEESLYPYPSQSLGGRNLDSLFRAPNDVPSLVRKSSFQSIGSDRWKTKDGGADTSSIGDSPGRAASTVESYQPFWSPIHTQAQSTTSISSFQSRPASMVSDVLTTRRLERTPPGKAAFLDELRQTLTSLLLSDLGSPVWSCGSETDAWFSDYLNQARIRDQMAKNERLDRFLADLSAPLSIRPEDDPICRSGKSLRRSLSAVSLLSRSKVANLATGSEAAGNAERETEDNFAFGYNEAFRRLMDQFSRHANPFTKLRALNDLRRLVIASLTIGNGSVELVNNQFAALPRIYRRQGRGHRNSVSEGSKPLNVADDQTPTPSSPVPATNEISSGSSANSLPSDNQIIRALRELIQKFQPKTLFRDLQFIAAFVPSEVLNKADAGTAFLQFGLAAFELKDDVCHSMVQIADNIVSQELNKRQRQSPFSPRIGNGIEDAARMWIITAQEGNAVAQRELAILYLTHPEILPRVTFPLTMPRETFNRDMMYRRDLELKSDPQSLCLALHWMQLSAAGGDELAQNRLREREEFESLA
ncbi:hypothetical protein CPC735_030490 [Coccidioides posadasii C735 delta SOWgp]|uniref:RGS domain-containing protein n=1 Tax=Coccidioides posadasii (strain C735) TaxID=222929 RepID=C5P4S3_COCP7|nr:hypothetical protein CPC735_030490 [Coccidioides posadasii C735 delta SOWgp]EER27713.1 hypothetical protein CPC735_030490 [Coccidioides posadasii C735 delta SOWgp]|eukprot:XP_003069858.1 hypothetical protein CPC735_030490 [Coccidioides posadasii C735 delta SOWgp]